MNLAPAIHHWGNLGVFLVIPLTLEPGPPVCGCCWTCHSCTSAEWHLLDSSSNLWLLWHHWKTRKRWKWAVKVYETSAKRPVVRYEPQSPACPPPWGQEETTRLRPHSPPLNQTPTPKLGWWWANAQCPKFISTEDKPVAAQGEERWEKEGLGLWG